MQVRKSPSVILTETIKCLQYAQFTVPKLIIIYIKPAKLRNNHGVKTNIFEMAHPALYLLNSKFINVSHKKQKKYELIHAKIQTSETENYFGKKR